jgi:hypothetical protein
MIKKYYLISLSDNLHWYTEDHELSYYDRWSPSIEHAYRFSSREEAETEILNEYFTSNRFFITELIVKE